MGKPRFTNPPRFPAIGCAEAVAALEPETDGETGSLQTKKDLQ